MLYPFYFHMHAVTLCLPHHVDMLLGLIAYAHTAVQTSC